MFFPGVFVPLFQSLCCRVGYDNRFRFAIILILSHIFFILFSATFAGSNTISLITLLIANCAILFSTKRRLADSQLNKNWLLPPSLSFLLIGLIIIFTANQTFYWLTLLSLSVASVLLTYPSTQKKRYIYGYNGPVDLSEQYKSNHNRRIEPTLVGGQQTNFEASNHNQNEYQSPPSDELVDEKAQQKDLGELIREQLLGRKNAMLTVGGIVTVIVLAMIMTTIISQAPAEPVTNKKDNNVAEIEDATLANSLTLPDDFTLMTTSYDGLVINWQADETTTTTLWNIRQAQGDKSCQAIKFNDGDTQRTTKVTVANTDDYFAEFSPLDTQKIINNIAARGSFTLCGYSFSLKGSQAVLGKHPFYAQQLSL